MKFQIKVTDEDIAGATRGDCAKCMITRALRRTLKRNDIFTSTRSIFHSREAYFKINAISIFDGDTVPMSDEVGGMIRTFDKGFIAGLFEFEIDIPDTYLKSTNTPA